MSNGVRIDPLRLPVDASERAVAGLDVESAALSMSTFWRNRCHIDVTRPSKRRPKNEKTPHQRGLS
jgi:hypothetical protein